LRSIGAPPEHPTLARAPAPNEGTASADPTGGAATEAARYAEGRRIVFLDCVRGVAASIVVIEHFLGLHGAHGTGPGSSAGTYSRWSAEYLSLGRIGVVAFFLVSGYVIPLSLERQSQRTFWIRRFFRLYPVYWLAVAAYIAVSWHALRDGGSLSAPKIALNVLMVQGAIGAVSILPPGWTLGIELLFYVQSAAAGLRRRLDKAVRLGWFWIGFFLLLSIGSHVSGHDLHPTFALLLFTAALGHSLHLRDEHGTKVWRLLFLAGAIVVPIGAALSQGRTPASQYGWQPVSYAASWFVGVALFCAFYALRRRELGRALTWLGAISYSVYLVHPTVFATAALIWGRTSYLTLFVGLAAVPVVSRLLFVTVERPSIALGRRLSRRPRTKPLAEVEAQAAP